MAKPRTSWIVLALLVVALVAIVYFYRSAQVLEVETVAVRRGDLVVTVTPTETGTVDSDATAQVKAEVAGRIREVRVLEGSRVAQGDVLLRLEDAESAARVALAHASLDAARTRLASARATLPLERARTTAAVAEAQARYDDALQRHDKKRRLYESRLIPLGEIESAAAELAAAEAALQAARVGQEQVVLQRGEIDIAAADVKQQEAALRVAQLALDHTLIRAPIAGTVVELPVKTGEWMQPGSTVARITRLDALYVKAHIDEVDLSRLSLGQAAEIQFDTQPTIQYAAKLIEIAPAVSVERLKSRNVTIKLRLVEPPPFLRPGMSADVEIVVDTVKDVLLVPAQTVMSKNRDQFVYVLDSGKVAARRIEVGRSNWDDMEVVQGLRVDDEVIRSLDAEGLRTGVRARRTGDQGA